MMLLLLQDAEQGGHHDLQQQLQRPVAPGAQGGDQVGVSSQVLMVTWNICCCQGADTGRACGVRL